MAFGSEAFKSFGAASGVLRMFILYEADYPDQTFPLETLRDAWVTSGLEASRISTSRAEWAPEDVRRLIAEAVIGAGGAPGGGTFELPDEALPLLERLEQFYLHLYPEMKLAPYQRSFHYERLEWLGEY